MSSGQSRTGGPRTPHQPEGKGWGAIAHSLHPPPSQRSLFPLQLDGTVSSPLPATSVGGAIWE